MTTSKALAAALVLWGVSAVAMAAEPTAAMKSIVAAAQKEGRLDLSWGAGLMGGDAGIAELAKLMNETYGTTITVRYTPGQNFPQTGAAIVTAQRANQPSPTDVYLGTNQQIGVFNRAKAFVPIDWPALMPDRVTPEMVEADGTALRVHTVIPGGILYNPKLVPYKPTRLVDLLKPEWKGKIASQPYASTFDLLAADGVWGEKALEFARDLSAQLGGLIRCNEIERIASGEFLAMAMDCTGREWTGYARKGMPIAHVQPADFAAVRYYYLTIPKNSVHPSAGRLFIATVISPKGQEILFRNGDVDLHTFPGSGMGKVIAEYEAQGVHFREYSVTWWEQHPEMEERLTRAIRIISRK